MKEDDREQAEGLIGSNDSLAIVGDVNLVGPSLVAYFMGC